MRSNDLARMWIPVLMSVVAIPIPVAIAMSCALHAPQQGIHPQETDSPSPTVDLTEVKGSPMVPIRSQPHTAYAGLTEQQVISKLGKPAYYFVGKYTSYREPNLSPPCANCTTFVYPSDGGELCIWFRGENGPRRCFDSELIKPPGTVPNSN